MPMYFELLLRTSPTKGDYYWLVETHDVASMNHKKDHFSCHLLRPLRRSSSESSSHLQ